MVSEIELLVPAVPATVEEWFAEFDRGLVRAVRITGVETSELGQSPEQDVSERLHETAEELKALGDGAVPDPASLGDEQAQRYAELKHEFTYLKSLQSAAAEPLTVGPLTRIELRLKPDEPSTAALATALCEIFAAEDFDTISIEGDRVDVSPEGIESELDAHVTSE